MIESYLKDINRKRDSFTVTCDKRLTERDKRIDTLYADMLNHFATFINIKS